MVRAIEFAQKCSDRASWLTAEHLATEVQAYRADAASTEARMDAAFERRFGIRGFGDIVRTWWGPKTDSLGLCLARQIPTWSSESVGLHLLARHINKQMPCVARPLAFTRDSYGRNPYKDSLVQPRAVKFNKEGKARGTKPVILVPPPQMAMTLRKNPIFQSLRVREGTYFGIEVPEIPLVELHYLLRSKVLGPEGDVQHDISTFHNATLRASMSTGPEGTPEHIYLDRDGEEVRVPARLWFDNRLTQTEMDNARPPASWYYTLYLSMFTTGEHVLVSTLDPYKVYPTFYDTCIEVERLTGKLPLVVWVPYEVDIPQVARSYGNEVNPSLLLNPSWDQHIKPPSPSAHLFNTMRYFREQILLVPPSKI